MVLKTLNLCQRVIAFCEKNIGLEIPSTDKFNNDDLNILNNFSSNIDNIVDKIDNQNINYYIDFVVGQLFNANKYFHKKQLLFDTNFRSYLLNHYLYNFLVFLLIYCHHFQMKPLLTNNILEHQVHKL